MAKLRFKADEVRKLYEHAKGCKEFREVYGRKPGPCLLLVHDDGVYLMSGGMPLLESPESRPGATKCVVAYAAGCDPRSDADFWETSRELVGGDDFGEPLPLAMFDLLRETTATVVLNVTARSISVKMVGHRIPASRCR